MNMPELISDISVVIPFSSNTHGLAATLVMLQAQLVPPRLIVVVDTTPTGAGYQLSKRYYTDTIPVSVIAAPYASIYEAWNLGIKMIKQGDIFVINDDLLLPMNTIDTLAEARKVTPALAYSPLTPPRDHYKDTVDMDYYWYANVPEKKADIILSDWMPGFAFMLTRRAIDEVGLFDEQFTVWYGDTDYERRLHESAKRINVPAIAQVKTCFVYHYGGSSYDYHHSNPVKAAIMEDKEKFNNKYPDANTRK